MKLFRVTPALIVVLLLCNKLNAKDQTPLDTGKIKEQFNYLIKKSNQYNDYRVIKSAQLFSLKKHVFDTIDGLKDELTYAHSHILKQSIELDSLDATLANTREDLAQAVKLRDNMSLLGTPISKAAYNSIMWFVTIGLFILLSVFVLMFKKSNSVTTKTKKDIEELKEELHNNRTRAREREEKVVRRLHDEINRYKKRVYQLEKSSQTQS